MFYILAAGSLIADPQSRDCAKGRFTTGTVRVVGDSPLLVSLIFSELAERLLEYAKGDTLAVSGRARLTACTGRDGVERHGISVVVEKIAAARWRRRAASIEIATDRPAPRSVRQTPRPSAQLHDDSIDDSWREEALAP